MEQTGQWECLHDGSMAIDIRCEDMGSEERGEKLDGHGDVDMDVCMESPIIEMP